jgi:hypothetical protein
MAMLSDLVYRSTPWFHPRHVEHDAFSDAEALKEVLMSGVTEWEAA